MSQSDHLAERRGQLSQTKQALLEKLRQGRPSKPSTQTSIPQRQRHTPAPASFAQQRLWLLEQLYPQRAFYHISTTMRLTGPLHRESLERAYAAIVQRHEILRTTLNFRDGALLQTIIPSLEATARLTLPIIDLSDLATQEQATALLQLAHEETSRPFDLGCGPLFRITLVRLSREQHILFQVIHHCIFDGASAPVFDQELSAFYNAFVQGKSLTLPDLPIQYADFALWQRQMLEEEVLQTQLNYWMKQLADMPSSLRLPALSSLNTHNSFVSKSCQRSIARETVEKLKKFTQTENATLFMTLLTAFLVTLCYYSDQEDIAVGTPIAGRTQAELTGLIGCFINTLILRTDLSGNPSFRALQQRVRQNVVGAFAHQDLPFEKLVEALHPKRNTASVPLVQVLFVMQNGSYSPPLLNGLSQEQLEYEGKLARFDLTMHLTETPEGISSSLAYNSDLFLHETIVQMADSFLFLLDMVASDPDLPLHTLRKRLSGATQFSTLGFNNAAPLPPVTQSIHDLIAQQASASPDTIALVCEDEHLTYQEMDRRANQLAHYLGRLGVMPDVCVGICMDHSLPMMIGILGILKAGGAYLPLPHSYPEKRLTWLVQETGARVILTQQHLSEKFAAEDAHVLCLDALQETIQQEAVSPPLNRSTLQNLAYVIYTSGSTGRPKGVMISHQGLTNYVEWCVQHYDVASGRGIPVHSSLGFDLTVTSLFPPLVVGKRVVLLPEQWGIEGLYRILMREGDFSLVKLTPAHLALLKQQLQPAEASGRTRSFIIGGEALHADDLQFWQTNAPETRLINEYGPTETVVGCCIYDCSTYYHREEARFVPIGRPIRGTQCYILDADLQPVPVTVWGELSIGGLGVARGYLKRADLTAERFLPDPYSSQYGARMYQTGDIARYTPDGTIEFQGRNDAQLKLRGYRIEPSEIEAHLRQHSAIQEAVVTLSQPHSHEGRLVASLVPRGALDVAELRNWLKQRLPEYLIPSAFLQLEALPLTVNGKVDRGRISHLASEDAIERTRASIPPRDLVEFHLAQIWQDLLQLQSIGITDDFFALGGHSFLAMRLLFKIQEQFGYNLPLTALFEYPTIEYQARMLRQPRNLNQLSSLVGIKATGSKHPLYLVHPTGGTIFCYMDLARVLEPELPLYGLQSFGLSGEGVPFSTVEEMAAYYIQALLRHQSQGPYHVGGWSMGGVIAFEMAQQLHRDGYEVAPVILIDAPAPFALATPESQSGTSLVTIFATNLLEGFFEQGLPEIYEKLESLEPDQQLPFVLAELKAANLVPSDTDLVQFHHLYQVFLANLLAARRYRASPFAGKVALFRAEDGKGKGTPNPAMGWELLAEKGVDVYHLPGNHYSIGKEPIVRQLAEQLARLCKE